MALGSPFSEKTLSQRHPAALEGADEISFAILGKTPESRRLVFPRPDGHLLCAPLTPPQ